jgi:hypothetical protein
MLTFVMCCLFCNIVLPEPRNLLLFAVFNIHHRPTTTPPAPLPSSFSQGARPPTHTSRTSQFSSGGGAATTTTLTGKTDGPIPHQPRRVTWSISMGEAAIYEVETAISAATTCTTAKPLPAGAIHTIFQIRMVFSGRVAWPGLPAGPGPAKIL